MDIHLEIRATAMFMRDNKLMSYRRFLAVELTCRRFLAVELTCRRILAAEIIRRLHSWGGPA
jgi:hypothetical protein